MAVVIFQSHIGAIRMALTKSLPLPRWNYFNPTLVQLELLSMSLRLPLQSHFNPTLVQLEYEWMVDRCDLLLDFNPTLVQLEWVQVINAGDAAHRFQSHIGAIRIESEEDEQIAHAYFNPTLVQLECGGTRFINDFVRNFNPTLVQLE